jgi:hypothetical protein
MRIPILADADQGRAHRHEAAVDVEGEDAHHGQRQQAHQVGEALGDDDGGGAGGGDAARLAQQERLDRLTQLPRGHGQGEAAQEHQEALARRHGQAQHPQVVLPAQVADQVVGGGQPQSAQRRPPAERGQRPRHLAPALPDGEAEVDGDAGGDAQEDPGEKLLHEKRATLRFDAGLA